MNIFFGENLNIVLIEHPTGIKYHGQVGGIACDHPEVEGFILPLTFMNWECLEGISCPDACCGSQISQELCNKLLKSWPNQDGELYQIVLDIDRLHLGTEAWFPIKIIKGREPREFSDIEKINQKFIVGKKGFLLMRDNCD